MFVNTEGHTDTIDPAAGLLRVKKRNGASMSFDSRKIMRAIVKAGQATGEFGQREADDITGPVEGGRGRDRSHTPDDHLDVDLGPRRNRRPIGRAGNG